MPNTVNRALNIPNTGDLPGAWGTAAVNPNMNGIDGMFGGVQSISLSTTGLTLSKGTGTISASAGPTQSDNAVIKLTGTLSSNCVLTFPCPGFWIVKNDCTVGAFYVQARAIGTGNIIGLPPGEAVHVYNDGTNFEFVDMGRVASFMDLCVSTTPSWMNACTVLPYLPCVGTATYSASVYPTLAAILGSTFGGNGITTFAPPDLGNRLRVPLGGGRLTSAGSGIDGATLGAAGGSQLLQAHTHTATLTDTGHEHQVGQQVAANFGSQFTTYRYPNTSGPEVTASSLTNITVANATTGSGTSGNVQPTIVAGIAFIKT